MSHGQANITTLYDADGEPVAVKLENGERRVMTTDERTHDKLDQIIVLLAQLIELQGNT